MITNIGHILCALRIKHSWEYKDMMDFPIVDGEEIRRVKTFCRCRRPGCPHYPTWQVIDVKYVPRLSQFS